MMRVKFECPINFIESEISRVFSVDNENPECIILNPGVDTFYGKEYFEQFKNLKVVGTPSTGVNHMDCEYLKKKEIKFYSLLDDRESLDSITASAEFTWLHIMNLVRKFSYSLSYVPYWRNVENEDNLRSRELSGRKLGIIGFGRIGKKLKRYAEAFEMQVKFYDPYVNGEGKVDSLQDLSDSDIISINCYLTEETNNMITYDVFKSFKDGIVTVELKGSCSGCPSSIMTLKQGVQNLLCHYIPEVKSVEAI